MFNNTFNNNIVFNNAIFNNTVKKYTGKTNYIFHEVEHFAKQTAKAIANASGLYGKLDKK